MILHETNLTKAIYIDLMLLGPKNHLEYKFRYIPVSLLWKWMHVWQDLSTI